MKAKSRAGLSGLSIVEVLVAIAILGVVSSAIVAVLPAITRNTQAASTDLSQTQAIQGALERIGSVWRDPAQYDGEFVGASTLEEYIDTQLGAECRVDTEEPDVARRRVTISCQGPAGFPDRTLRSEFPNPAVF